MALATQLMARSAGRLGLLAATAALAACSSVPVPTAEMALARSALDRAGASPAVVATAPVELQQARAKLTRAEAALADKRYTEARRLAEEAEADARLAESKASARRSLEALDEVRRANQALGDELLRRPAAR